jgi:hypothetical protein
MKLSIIVPTNKRFRLAELAAKTARTVFNGYNDVEVILSDSSPTHGCIAPEGVILKWCPYNFDSAEEHFIYAMRHAKGEYIWILGDDDTLNIHGAMSMYKMICNNESDFFLFNQHCYIDGKIHTGNVQCSEPDRIKSISEYVLKAGMWYGLAAISNSIFKRPSSFELQMYDVVKDYNLVYSHVVWFLYIYKGRRFKYINTPIVNYTISPTCWPEWCLRHGVSESHPWTIGFMNQIKFLNKVYGNNYFSGMLGAEWFGTRDKSLTYSAYMFINDLFRKNKTICRKLTTTEVTEYTDWIISQDPFFSVLLPCSGKSEQEVRSLIESYRKSILHNNFIERYRYFNIYILFDEYLAISINALDKIDIFISDLTPKDLPFFFVSTSIEDIKLKIDKAISCMCIDLHASAQNEYFRKFINMQKSNTTSAMYTSRKTLWQKIKGWFV